MITSVDIAVVSIMAFKEIKINLPGTAWLFPFLLSCPGSKIDLSFHGQNLGLLTWSFCI